MGAEDSNEPRGKNEISEIRKISTRTFPADICFGQSCLSTVQDFLATWVLQLLHQNCRQDERRSILIALHSLLRQPLPNLGIRKRALSPCDCAELERRSSSRPNRLELPQSCPTCKWH